MMPGDKTADKNPAIRARFVGLVNYPVDLAGRLLSSAREAAERTGREAAQRSTQAVSAATTKIRRARARAYRVGQANGQRAANQALQGKLLELQAQYEHIVRSANEDCLALVCAISEEVIGYQIQHDTVGIATRISQALSRLVDQRAAKIFVNPLDADSVRAQLAPFEVLLDPGIARGNARLQTLSGSMELDWRDHVALIRSRLDQHLSDKLTNATNANGSVGDSHANAA